MSPRYKTFRDYLTRRVGAPVLKVPVNGGFSCPNRDGTLGSAGCSFCDNRSFSPAARANGAAALQQLRLAMQGPGKRFKHFMPYLQPFSNTHAPVDVLASVYEPLVAEKGVVGLSIGTRPDCLGPAVTDYLRDIASRTFLVVEIGLQSSHNETLARVNRGHRFEDFVAAVELLANRGIHVAAHIILGLPGEAPSHMLKTAERLARLPVQGVKIHQLMVVAGTPIEAEYNRGTLTTLDIKEYSRILGGILERLRPDQYLHRLMADSKPDHGLIAPSWSADKPAAMKTIQVHFENENIVQGSMFVIGDRARARPRADEG